MLAVLKIVATALCYGSGNAGGIFGPALFIGAMIGGTVGSVAHTMFPAYTAAPGAYALVGMGAAFAGIVRTPLTSVIMIFEVTRDYTIIVPLMIANLISFFISYRLQEEPIYEALAHQDGVHLPAAGTRSQPERYQVASIMREPPEVLSPETKVEEAATRLQRYVLDGCPLVDGQGLWGMVRKSDLENAIARGRKGEELADLFGTDRAQLVHAAIRFPHLHTDHSVGLALQRMGETAYTVLPVVSRANVRQLMGIVVLGDILEAYGVSKLYEDPDHK